MSIYTKSLIAISALLLTNQYSLAAEISVGNVDALAIGETVEVTQKVCDTQAGDDDWSVRSNISFPAGLEILSAEPVVHSADEGSIKIEGVTQPGQITVSQEVAADLQTKVDQFAATLGDDAMNARVQLAGSALKFSTVLNGDTHARINYHCHAEGHKYGPDGHIRASIKATLVRGPISRDYQKIILELATLTPPVTEEALQGFFDTFKAIGGYEPAGSQ